MPYELPNIADPSSPCDAQPCHRSSEGATLCAWHERLIDFITAGTPGHDAALLADLAEVRDSTFAVDGATAEQALRQHETAIAIVAAHLDDDHAGAAVLIPTSFADAVGLIGALVELTTDIVRRNNMPDELDELDDPDPDHRAAYRHFRDAGETPDRARYFVEHGLDPEVYDGTARFVDRQLAGDVVPRDDEIEQEDPDEAAWPAADRAADNTEILDPDGTGSATFHLSAGLSADLRRARNITTDDDETEAIA